MEADAMRRVRTCVLAVAVAAPFGFVGPGATARGGNPDPVQTQAVEAIERVGGSVSPGGRFVPLGLVVVIEGSKASDDDLTHLSCLKSLSVLVLDGTRVSDAGLAHIKEL